MSVVPGGSERDTVSYNPAGLRGKVVCPESQGGGEDGSCLMGKAQQELG